jgi:hypothetical protein
MTHAQENQAPRDDFETEHEVVQDTIPSWFSRTYGDTDLAGKYRENREAHPVETSPLVAENAAAYEAYRQRLEQRFATAQHITDPTFISQDNARAASGPAFPERPSFSQGMVGDARQRPQARKQAGFKPATLAILTLTACAIGGGVGYVAANPNLASQSIAYVNSFWFDPVGIAAETVIEKKPVRTAKLEVKDAAGAINSPIPLNLAALPADAAMPVALRITGLPPSAYLTKGVEVAKGEWMLKEADFKSTELIVPYTDVPQIALQVAALDEKTGVQAAPTQRLNVAIDRSAVPVPGVPQPKVDGPPRIVPVSALPDQGFNKVELPAAIPVPLESINPEAQILITKGDLLLKTGDILAARQFYLRAFGMKVTSAAYGVGQTYDPAVYTKFKIKGLTADPQQALEWYGKAAAEGHQEAAAALAGLPAQP